MLLRSMASWLAATALERTAAALALAATLPEFTLEAGWDPPRLVHRASGLAFVIVPGGVVRMGFSEEEAARLFTGEFLATRAGDTLLCEGGMVGVMHLMRSAWPVRQVHVAPLLMAVTCLPVAAAGGPDLRLPSESEWEHAVRAGTQTPFYWGDEVPMTLAHRPHPLGLELVGWADELVADLWQPDLRDVPRDGRPQLAGVVPVVRGGAASAGMWPTTLAPPEAAWRLLSARRRPAVGADVWVRPVMSLPVDRHDAAAAEIGACPKPTFAPRVRGWLMALHDPDARARQAARVALRARVAGPGIWTMQGELALTALVPLVFDARVPERAELLVLIADLVCGYHSGLCATGLLVHDQGAVVALTNASHVRMRAAVARAPVATLLTTQGLAAAAALLVGLLPELAVPALPVLAARALDDADPGVRASMMLACGLAAHASGRAVPAIASGLDDATALVRGAASLAQLMADARVALDAHGALLPDHHARLVAFAQLTPLPREQLPWHDGALDRLVYAVMGAHVPSGRQRAESLLAQALSAPPAR